MISAEKLTTSMSYAAYDDLLQALVKEGKTTGNNQTEEFIEYGRVNLQRMHRVHKTLVLTNELKQAVSNIQTPHTLLVITEGWCGDSAQIVPVFDHLCRQTNLLELRFVLRDDNANIMDRYLTNGARSIPKVICFETATLVDRFVWGPRPKALQDEVIKLLEAKVSKEEKGLFVQKWYNADKTLSIQQELTELFARL